MSDIAIKFEDVSKQYRLGVIGTGTISHDLNRWWHLARGKEDPYLKIGETNDRTKKTESGYVWALRDISFDIKQGDIVGIIGRNGAGKSTLLKLLSRVTAPTTGLIKAKGRIGSLLEVGTGFHPELTGRENIYMNGAIMGMSRAEITSKLDEIIDFAGVEKYIDTPTKRYSSGMTVRLGFAVAAHLEPEILVVDEVLAVGDIAFQKKAIGKLKDVSTGQGRTVLFVSHNMGSVRRLCKSGILLENGTVKDTGDIEKITDLYIKNNECDLGKKRIVLEPNPNKSISITEVSISAKDKGDNDIFDVNDSLIVKIYYTVHQEIQGASVTFSLSKEGILLFRTWDTDNNINLFNTRKRGNYVTEFRLPNNLQSGSYSVYVDVGVSRIGVIQSLGECLHFDLETIYEDATHKSSGRGGIIRTSINWDTKQI